MRLGLITDIHEHNTELRASFAALESHAVDRIVCLGDVVETGRALHETVALLAERGIPGVWGNHDFGLCSHPSALVSSRRAAFAGPVLDYLATFKSILEIEDCSFSHVEPWRDLNDIMELWSGELPDTAEKAARSFDGCPSRVMFTGHHHRWLVASQEGVIPWDGKTTMRLEAPQRYLVVVGAVCEGRCGIYDTGSLKLTPISLR